MQSVEQLAGQLGSGDQVKAYQARQALTAQVAAAGAADKQEDRKQLAAALVEAATATRKGKDNKDKETTLPTYSAEVRRELLKQVGTIVGDPQVPQLRKALEDSEVRDSARCVLDLLETQASTDALVAVLDKASGAEFQVGVIAALGRRRGSNVVEALKQATQAPNVDVRLAACEALAYQPDAAVDEIIMATRAADPAGSAQRARQCIERSRLQLAATLTANGQKDAAAKILKDLANGQEGDPQRDAAEAALARLA